MSARILFVYAVALMALVLVAFFLADGPIGKHALIVPGICALLVSGVAAAGSFIVEHPRLRLLILRMASTLPLIIAAALAMRATRIGHFIKQAAPGAESLESIHAVIWTMAVVSVIAFLLLQYQRFQHGNR